MRLDTSDISFDPKAVSHVRVDKIGGTADGLWWVALAFAGGSTKPEGMFTSQTEAMAMAGGLASTWNVDVEVSTDL